MSPLFNFSGMNIFNFKAKVLPANYHHKKYLPAIAAGGVHRTNDPFVAQSVKHKNATNADVYLVGTKPFAIGEKFGFLASAGVRGTNAQNYGYGGNALDWQARAFGTIRRCSSAQDRNAALFLVRRERCCPAGRLVDGRQVPQGDNAVLEKIHHQLEDLSRKRCGEFPAD